MKCHYNISVNNYFNILLFYYYYLSYIYSLVGGRVRYPLKCSYYGQLLDDNIAFATDVLIYLKNLLKDIV